MCNILVKNISMHKIEHLVPRLNPVETSAAGLASNFFPAEIVVILAENQV